MILATADSNIYIAALLFDGTPLQFLNAARAGAFRLAVSEAILAEIRGGLLNKFHWSENMLDEAVSGIRDFTLVVTPRETIHVVTEDPDDDRVIECAMASGSQLLSAATTISCV